MSQRVGELRVLIERPVADDQRDVALARGQAEPVLLVAAQQEHPGQPGVDVGTGEVHRVVVVPERRGGLLQRVGVGPRPGGDAAGDRARPGVAVVLVRGAGRQHRVGRVAVVLGWGAAAVQVQHGRDVELVAQRDLGRLPRPGPDRGAGERAVVGHQPGAAPGQHLHVDGPGDQLVCRSARAADARRSGGQGHRQRHRERPRQRDGAGQDSPGRPGARQGAGAAGQGQERDPRLCPGQQQHDPAEDPVLEEHRVVPLEEQADQDRAE